MPFADGWEMTEEQAIIILLDMLNGLTPPLNVREKAYRTVILAWVARNASDAKGHSNMQGHVSSHFPWPDNGN